MGATTSNAGARMRRMSMAAAISTGATTPSTPRVTAYSSRMVDKLQLRCDELEQELETMRSESAKREEDLRQMLREKKVDAKVRDRQPKSGARRTRRILVPD